MTLEGKQRSLGSFYTVLVLALLLIGSCTTKKSYHHFEGPVFGTSFHISYEYTTSSNLDQNILRVLKKVNQSLSTYDSKSLISRINRNDYRAKPDDHFTRVFQTGQEVSRTTGGAFDMTVAPLVNAWGFGFTEREQMTPTRIDSILEFIGYTRVRLEEGRIVKDDPRLMLDASAIAKGYGVDVVAEFLESRGVKNYLVEIGGELRCLGVNSKGEQWRVGIDKPIENILDRTIQTVMGVSDISMATSGNYRQFYVENGIRYSHTIDPKTGYPARSNLLSATVLARECMIADAYATAFMVMGLENSIELSKAIPYLSVYFIYSDEDGRFLSWYSDTLAGLIKEN